MSTDSDFVFPSLSQLTELFISAIYKATSQADTSIILDCFLFKDAHITVNGKNISRHHFLKELQSEKFLEQGADVKFLNIVEVDSPASDAGSGAGSVGTFFNVTIQEAIPVRVGGAPVSVKVAASLNVDIEQDHSIPVPPPSKIHGFSDRRKAKALNLVILDTPVPTGIVPESPGN